MFDMYLWYRRNLTASFLSAPKVRILLWISVVFAITLVLILVRILWIHGPSVFADEYTYAAWVAAFFYKRSVPPPLAPNLGSWLYLRVYELAFIHRSSFLVGARILNAVVSAIGASALVTALLTAEKPKRYLLTAALSIGIIVSLLGDYAAYFMPDAPYFALVCVWLLIVAFYIQTPGVWLAIAVGIVGGITTMVKAHGILILPVTIVVFGLSGAHRGLALRSVCIHCLFLIFTWFICTSAVSFFLGNGNLNPIGSLYTQLGNKTVEHASNLGMLDLLQLTAHHLVTVELILGMPLFLSIWLAIVALFHLPQHRNHGVLQYYALASILAFIGMLFVTVVFTVSMAGTGLGQTLTRLYGRYYEHFALLAACFGIIGSEKILIDWRWTVRLVFLALFLVLLGSCWWASSSIVGQYPVDYATAYGLYSLHSGRAYAALLGGVGAIIAVLWPRHAPLALSCTLLIWLGINTVAMERSRWSMGEPAAGRVAALVERGTVDAPDATVEIVGPGGTIAVFRAGFHLLNKRITFALGTGSSQCGYNGRMPDWVIAVNGARDPCGYKNVIRIEDALVASRTVSFPDP